MPSIGSASITHLQDPIPALVSPTQTDKTFTTDVFITIPGEIFHSTDVFVGGVSIVILKYTLTGSSSTRERPLFNYEFPQTLFVVVE